MDSSGCRGGVVRRPPELRASLRASGGRGEACVDRRVGRFGGFACRRAGGCADLHRNGRWRTASAHHRRRRGWDKRRSGEPRLNRPALLPWPAMENLVLRLPQIVIQLLAFAVAISVHESAHGWVAERLGDPTARWLGRITLNPIKHGDLIGTLIFPLMLAFLGAPIIGWAKPVPLGTRNPRHQERDPGLGGLAGPRADLIGGAGG